MPLRARNTAPPTTRLRRLPLLAPLALLLVLAGFLMHSAIGSVPRSLRMLESDQPHERKQAAWRCAELALPALADALLGRLEREPDADVREALVYSIGLLGRAADWEALAHVAARDPSGYVRCSAWLAAARVDAPRTRAGLDQPADRYDANTDAWDRLGMAQARCQAGDVGGIEELLWVAEHGQTDQRRAASRALDLTLRSLLTIAGRWPIHLEVADGASWTVELIAEARRRGQALNLPQIAAESARHWSASERVHRSVFRLAAASDRIARVLAAW